MCQFNNIFDWYSIFVDEPRADDEESSSSSCMAVNTNSASVSEAHLKNIHDSHHMFESSTGHIFPTLVKAVNAMVIELLRDIAESNMGDDSVSAKRMFSGFLEV